MNEQQTKLLELMKRLGYLEAKRDAILRQIDYIMKKLKKDEA